MQAPKRPHEFDDDDDAYRNKQLALHSASDAPGKGKRQRVTSSALSTYVSGASAAPEAAPPTMRLEGHAQAVYCVKFSPDGTALASASHDRTVLLWRTTEDCASFVELRGHKNAVLDVRWMPDGQQLITASPDNTLRLWDASAAKSVRKFTEHASFVHAVDVSPRDGAQLAVSASDDGTAKVWDTRQRESVATFEEDYQVLACAMAPACDMVHTGSLDGDIRTYDLRAGKLCRTMRGHADAITDMQTDAEGSYLLSNAMDETLRVWDVRSFAPKQRCTMVAEGHTHGFERNMLRCAWSKWRRDASTGAVHVPQPTWSDGDDGGERPSDDGDIDASYVSGDVLIAAGSSDRCLNIWNATTGASVFRLAGHKGSVNAVDFHPSEPMVASGGQDRVIMLGPLVDESSA